MLELKDFNDYLQSEINEEIELYGKTSVENFTEIVSNKLIQNGTIDNFSSHFFGSPNIYGFSFDIGHSISFFTSKYFVDSGNISLKNEDVEEAIKDGKEIFSIIASQNYPEDKKDLNYSVYKEISKIDLEIPSPARGKIILLTNAKSNIAKPHNIRIGEYIIEIEIYDIEKLYELFFGSTKRNSIDVNFTKVDSSIEIPCIPIQSLKNKKVSSYIAVFPGRMLYNIYSMYGSKILQQNVRGFLSSTGKINKGIKETIMKEPELFFSYNNGISILGTDISIKKTGSLVTIRSIDDFQVVNGGQTVSSIYFTKKNNISAQIRDVDVLAKVSILNNLNKNSQLLENIALYNNSQNNISLPDLSSNSQFNVEVEAISNRLQTPFGKFWFYERHRGNYSLRQKNASNSKSALKDFKDQYPKKQLLTKEKLAKILVSWKQYPHESCKGPAKIFTFFTEEILNDIATVNEKIFKTFISQAILFNAIYILSKKIKLRGGKAGYCTNYLFAYLSFISKGKLNVKQIWENQDISDELKENCSKWLLETSNQLDKITMQNDTSIGECVKTRECWEDYKESEIIKKNEIKFSDF